MHHNYVPPDNVEKPPYSTSPVPSNLGDLKFNPLDVYNLRRFIGTLPGSPGAYATFRARFDAADIAYFAAGCSTDGKHDIGADRFHLMVKDMYSCKYGSFNYESRKKLRDRVQTLTFDMAALWDRAFGGSTIVIHVEGSHQPNVPNVPENTRAAVYLPPSTVVKELPDAHETIAFIVQAFIEQVGIPTIDRWTVAAKNHLNFSLTMSGRAPIKSYTSFIPPPVKVGYAHYIFQGLPSRTVMHCTNCFQVQGRAEYSPDGRRDLSNGEPGEVAETYDREYGIHFAELETGYLEQISSLGAEVKQYQERIISLEEEIVRLNVILKDRESVLPPHSSPGVHLRAPRSMTLQTPTRNRTGSPAHSPAKISLFSPSRSDRSPAKRVNLDLPNCERVLSDSGSDANLLSVIPVILRNTPPQFWRRELVESGISDQWADEMVQAMTADS